jgi:hypothetical protein
MHTPFNERLRRLIDRGQHAGEFDPSLPPAWLLAATIALGHAAGDEVAAGRLSSGRAGAALRDSCTPCSVHGPVMVGAQTDSGARRYRRYG